MSDATPTPTEFALVGYEKLTDHGFALPCFARAGGFNSIYIASATSPGDPRTLISAFNPYVPENLILLTLDQQRGNVKIHDQWIDVFLWKERTYVGTKAAIWESLTPERVEIAAHAPLTLLALAEGVSRELGASFGPIALGWLTSRYGVATAFEWLLDTYLRGIAIRILRSRMRSAPLWWFEDVRLIQKGKNIIIWLPAPIVNTGIEISAFGDLQIAAQAFELNVLSIETGRSSGRVDTNDTNDTSVNSVGRIGVIQISADALNLVVFERIGSTVLPILEEQVICGLGRDIGRSGRLSLEGVELVFANLQRFVALARAMGTDHLSAIATSVVREASDGAAFAAEIERQCGLRVRILDGNGEARLLASGVLTGIFGAQGIIGNLDGNSVELVRVDAKTEKPIGEGTSLPLGPLRLAEHGKSSRAVIETIERAVERADLLRTASGETLFLAGDAWHAIARLHMEQTHYPLHIIHQYEIARRPAEGFLDIIAGQSSRSLERITAISPLQLDVVPLAALILRRLIAAGRPEHIVFSAFGLREGYAYGLLPKSRGSDLLIETCIGIAASQSRWVSGDGDRLREWTAPLFPALDAARLRLHRAACWLSDIGWTEHPDYRAAQAFERSLKMPLAQINHGERVFVAATLHARYGGAAEDPVKLVTRPLLVDGAETEARALGLALQLAYSLCGGELDLLNHVRLSRAGRTLVLELPPTGSLFNGEIIQRQLDALGRELSLSTVIKRRAGPP